MTVPQTLRHIRDMLQMMADRLMTYDSLVKSGRSRDR
jgi:hypothetical protein